MSVVTYTGIQDDDVRSAASVNAIWAAFTTASAALAVDYTNVADEGLDGRNIATGQHTDGRQSVGYTGGGNAPVLNAYPFSNLSTTFTVGGIVHHLDNTGTTWGVGQNSGYVRVWFGAAWKRISDAPTPLLYFRLQYKLDGAGTWSDVPKSLRVAQMHHTVALDSASAAITDGNWYDSLRYAFDIPFPLDAATHVLNDVRVVAADEGAGLVTFVKTFFRAKRYRKSLA